MRNQALKSMILNKTNIKLSFLSNVRYSIFFILTFGQVPQNAKNDRSNYESFEIETDDI